MTEVKVVLTIEAEDLDLETIDSVLDSAGNRYSVTDVTEPPRRGRQKQENSKGQTILKLIKQTVADETFVSRQDIADEADATVSRVAEIIKEYLDDEDVALYKQTLIDKRSENKVLREKAKAEKAEAKKAEKAVNAENAPKKPSRGAARKTAKMEAERALAESEVNHEAREELAG